MGYGPQGAVYQEGHGRAAQKIAGIVHPCKESGKARIMAMRVISLDPFMCMDRSSITTTAPFMVWLLGKDALALWPVKFHIR